MQQLYDTILQGVTLMKESKQTDRLRQSIRLLARKLDMLTKGEAQCCGITFTQCHIITEIGWVTSASLNTLSELLGVDKSTMSRNIENMVVSGIVERQTDPDNRRVLRISLTDKGMGLFNEIESSMKSFYDETLLLIPQEKRSQVIESLDLLAKAIPIVKS